MQFRSKLYNCNYTTQQYTYIRNKQRHRHRKLKRKQGRTQTRLLRQITGHMEQPSVQQQQRHPHMSHFIFRGNVFFRTPLIRVIDAANSSGATFYKKQFFFNKSINNLSFYCKWYTEINKAYQFTTVTWNARPLVYKASKNI